MTRRASVPALAKINLDLRVLGKRPDGYHEIRTVFQTISLADSIEIAFTPGRRMSIALDDPLAIPENLVVRAAALAGVKGRIEMRLEKRIPMGAGLGGGSSDAAAVLLALPVLAGRRVPLERLCEIAGELGSDVPFFLLGGTAAGIGRGSEVFPLPDAPRRYGLGIAPGIHVSTQAAYSALGRRLTTGLHPSKIFSFQSLTWGGGVSAANDFEAVVWEMHPELAVLWKRLRRAGAAEARMTGSGSALFGLFPSRDGAHRAKQRLGDERTFSFSLVSRARYRRMWWKALQPHLADRTWPPESRYR